MSSGGKLPVALAKTLTPDSTISSASNPRLTYLIRCVFRITHLPCHIAGPNPTGLGLSVSCFLHRSELVTLKSCLQLSRRQVGHVRYTWTRISGFVQLSVAHGESLDLEEALSSFVGRWCTDGSWRKESGCVYSRCYCQLKLLNRLTRLRQCEAGQVRFVVCPVLEPWRITAGYNLMSVRQRGVHTFPSSVLTGLSTPCSCFMPLLTSIPEQATSNSDSLPGRDCHVRSSYSSRAFRRSRCPSEPAVGAITIKYLARFGVESRSSSACREVAASGKMGSIDAFDESCVVYTWNI
jgi:hypothetical protein